MGLQWADLDGLGLHDAGFPTASAAVAAVWVDGGFFGSPGERAFDGAGAGAGAAFGGLPGEAVGAFEPGGGEFGQGGRLVVGGVVRGFGLSQRLGLAGGGAGPVGAAVAAPVAQVERRGAADLRAQPGGEGEDDLVRTGLDAVAAAGAGEQEFEFGQGPGGADPVDGALGDPFVDLLDDGFAGLAGQALEEGAALGLGFPGGAWRYILMIMGCISMPTWNRAMAMRNSRMGVIASRGRWPWNRASPRARRVRAAMRKPAIIRPACSA